jgi:multiple antibiotic resistance protein
MNAGMWAAMWAERLSEFVTLLVVVNPIGAVPFFLAITRGQDTATRRKIAVNAVLISFGVLVAFIIGGGFLLEKMGIALRAFQIAGGIVLFLVALNMLTSDGKAPPPASSEEAMSLAAYPLAIPKIAGPGTMLTVVVLTDDHRFDVVQTVSTAGVLAIVLAIQLALLFLAVPLSRLIGETGANILGRVMGMILIALAVNLILTGFGSWLSLPKL